MTHTRGTAIDSVASTRKPGRLGRWAFVLAVAAIVLPLQARAAHAACDSIAFGALPANGSIGIAGEVECYSFDAAAGDRIRVRVIPTSGSLEPWVELEGPGNLQCGPTTADEFTCSPVDTGVHTLVVRDYWGPGTGTYATSVQRLNDPADCAGLAFGATPAGGSISVAGGLNCYTFTAAIGDQIRLRLIKTSGSLEPWVELEGPEGTTLCGSTTNDEFTCIPAAAGRHTLLVRDYWGPGTGEYAPYVQRLNNPVGCLALAFGGLPTAATIGVAGEVSCYTLTAAVGDRIRVRAIKTSGSLEPWAELERPAGTTLCGSTTNDEFTCSPDSGGVHTLLMRDYWGLGTGGYSLYIERLNGPPDCAPLSFGAAPTIGSIGLPGEADCYTFTAAIGDQIRLRLIKTSGSLEPWAEIEGPPSGATLCGSTTNDEFTCVPSTPGSHTVFLRDYWGTGTGGYALYIQRLNNPVGCAAMAFGAPPKIGSIGQAADTDCYTFTAAVGDHIRLRVIKTSGGLEPWVELEGPAGTTLCGSTTNDEFTCIPASAGRHTLLVRDYWGPGTGGYTAYVQRLNTPLGCAPLTFGALPKAATIGTAGEVDCYTFTAAAGDHVRVRVIKTSGTLEPWVELERPAGTTLCGPTTSDEFICTPDTSGAHSILVRDYWGPGTGGYTAGVGP